MEVEEILEDDMEEDLYFRQIKRLVTKFFKFKRISTHRYENKAERLSKMYGNRINWKTDWNLSHLAFLLMVISENTNSRQLIAFWGIKRYIAPTENFGHLIQAA